MHSLIFPTLNCLSFLHCRNSEQFQASAIACVKFVLKLRSASAAEKYRWQHSCVFVFCCSTSNMAVAKWLLKPESKVVWQWLEAFAQKNQVAL